MHTTHQYTGKVGFAIGTGRCGTEFIARAAGLEPHVAASHERNPYNETFQRYVKWYGLPVDNAGFLHQKAVEIAQDLESHTYSFESSAYLSLSLHELYERFGAKFVLLVRSPERVVNSFLHKGWYAEPTVREDPDLAPGFQACESFHHVLARFVPSGEKFLQWNGMTRIGKLAWYWNAMNERILEQFKTIPVSHWRIEKIEGLSYARYLELAGFLGYEVSLGEADFQALVRRRPNSFQGVPTIAAWNEQETAEFEAEVAPMAETLGYAYRVAELPAPAPRTSRPQKRTFWGKVRESLVGTE